MKRLTTDKFLSDAELEAFMAAVRSRRHRNQHRDYVLFTLLANTGIRPSEAIALRREDVDVESRRPSIRVLRCKKRSPRTDTLVITRDLARAIETYVKARPVGAFLFEITRRQAERLFHFYRSSAGIRRGLHLYALRHTAATRIYRATRDIAIVQAVLGHERPDTSCIYAHVTTDMLREMAAKFPAVV